MDSNGTAAEVVEAWEAPYPEQVHTLDEEVVVEVDVAVDYDYHHHMQQRQQPRVHPNDVDVDSHPMDRSLHGHCNLPKLKT